MSLQEISESMPNFNLKNRLTTLSILTCLPFTIIFSLESIYRGDFSSTRLWVTDYPKQFLFSYLIMFGVINLFFVLKRKLYLSIGSLLLAFFSIIGLISKQKLILRGEPLLPWDLILGREALNVVNNSSGSFQVLPLLVIGLITAVLLILVRFVPEDGLNYRKRLTASLISLIMLVSFYAEADNLKKAFSLQLVSWSQKLNNDENGVLLGFILNTSYLSISKPDNYDQKLVDKIVDDTKPSYPVDPNFKPNIVMVMSEAFWDPTLLKEVSFSQDPIPFFHSLQKSQTSGVMLSPVYGGGTANTEFEVLTGMSTQFLPQGIIPYVEYIRKPIEALPTILKKQGYMTTAIHTNDNWFYGRNSVYQNLDFDRFISKEFFVNPEYSGGYIRDTELSQRILEEMYKTDQPDFIYAISMQAHGPYSSEANPSDKISLSGKLSPDSKAILENYTNIVSDVDQSIRLLIEGLKKSSEPTLVVFFGDHLPMLGNNFKVYKEANFFQDDVDYQDYLKMHSVPFVVWDNFSTAKENLRLSSNFLGSYILERTKKSGSLTTNFLRTITDKGSSVIINKQHWQKETISLQDISQYELLQYDLLFGSEYAYLAHPDHQPPLNTGYVLGDGQAVIVNASPPQTSLIEIQGKNFSQDHKVYVNGQEVQTNFEDPTYLTASLPVPFRNPSGALDIQVKLIDSMGNIISESNTFKLGAS